MLPLLVLLNDKKPRLGRECWGSVADSVGVTDIERLQMLSSGNQSVFVNRASWAATYLFKAGLIARPSRGMLQITERGLEALHASPDRIDKAYLRRYPEYLEFRARGHEKSSDDGGDSVSPPDGLGPELTPDEAIASGYRQFNASLVDEVLTRIRTVTPAFFERLVIELLVAMGYGGSFEDAASVVGRSGDGGIDGVIKEDRLGLDAIYVQAKRWQGTVGRPVVAEFVGNLAPHQSSKGVMITTSSFTEDAKRWIGQVGRRIVLVDGQQLAELMIEHGVGVTPLRTYTLKRIDNDYFDEEG